MMRRAKELPTAANEPRAEGVVVVSPQSDLASLLAHRLDSLSVAPVLAGAVLAIGARIAP